MLNKKLHTWHLGAPNTHWWHIFSDYSYYISRVRRRTRALIATHNLLLSQRLLLLQKHLCQGSSRKMKKIMRQSEIAPRFTNAHTQNHMNDKVIMEMHTLLSAAKRIFDTKNEEFFFSHKDKDV